MTAHDYLEFLQYPVFFYAGNGAPAGQSIAIIDEECADNLPVQLSELEGTVRDDGTFEATNLTDGNGPNGWRFSDYSGNIIYKVQLFNDQKIFERQRRDYDCYI